MNINNWISAYPQLDFYQSIIMEEIQITNPRTNKSINISYAAWNTAYVTNHIKLLLNEYIQSNLYNEVCDYLKENIK